ncbi:hypothetical protein [Pseudothermotoga thermarum]|uniref:Uncharacterized protein n=1 Tax=Pseudothermotoga thermarum DSM 5069 TaxID=688269 RepID=F7YTY9_9THEM|nr:hypothetical protein [Pseudothermotoga thermarum]AEH51571.1 hypothetical protein Theth_1518 [Pseudothermotoga thermarum DSM 5069]
MNRYWFIFILPTILLLTTCVQLQYTPALDEHLVRCIAIAYNKGHNWSVEQLVGLIDETNYDDDVWNSYLYFLGKIDLPTFVALREPTVYDTRIIDYFKSVLFSNNSSTDFVDYFNKPLPLDHLNPQKVSNEDLSKRVYELIKHDYSTIGLFRTWYEKYFEDELSEKAIYEYAKTLVEIAESYTFEMQSYQSGSGFFTSRVNLNSIPTELVLAIMYKESRLFPASFRAEINGGKILSISLGLGHILVDADSFSFLAKLYDDIGNEKQDLYTFELLRNYYFPNLSAEELLQIRGSVLFVRTYLALLRQKVEPNLR